MTKRELNFSGRGTLGKDSEIQEILADVLLLVRGLLTHMHHLLDRTEILISESVEAMVKEKQGQRDRRNNYIIQ